MSKVFTGLLDCRLHKIYEGDYLWVGMRREDPVAGWTLECVVRGESDGEPWMLAHPENGERMQMQWDQELRGRVEPDKRDAEKIRSILLAAVAGHRAKTSERSGDVG